MRRFYLTTAEIHWLEDLALQHAIDYETGKTIGHPFAADIVVRWKLAHPHRQRKLTGWLTAPKQYMRRGHLEPSDQPVSL